MDLISGERFQDMCDIFLGEADDFQYNPHIWMQKRKHMYLHSIRRPFRNPKLIFCYTNRIPDLLKKISYFQVPFVLVSHNSDATLSRPDDIVLADHPMIIHWFSQNVNIRHPKLTAIPIGIANKQWNHGNPKNFQGLPKSDARSGIYFNFSVNTNRSAREPCRVACLKKGLSWVGHMTPYDYMRELCKYSFAICPDGNGIDCHRMWECLYAGVVPICTRSVHSETWASQFPIVLLDSWNDLDTNKISEVPLVTRDESLLQFSRWADIIRSKVI